MIKQNELRIGNVVLLNGVICSVDCGEDIDWYSFDPILMTEEWLLKFGFVIESNRGESWYQFENMQCVIGKKIWFNNEDFDFDEMTVHRFQNIYFALYGEEIKIIEI